MEKRENRSRFNMKILTLCGLLLATLNYPATALSIGDRSKTGDVKVNSAEDKNVCETQVCRDVAKEIIDFMDPTVNPCDDFYQFVCGSFVKKTVIPEFKSSVTIFSLIDDMLQDQLRDIFEHRIQDESKKPFGPLRTFYNVCMNTTQVNANSQKELLELLDSLGGWPVLAGEAWDESKFDWLKSSYTFQAAGYSTDLFVSTDIDIDRKNNTKRIISLDQAILGLSQKYLRNGTDDKVVKAYYSYMVDFAVMMGADREVAERELMDSLKFEMELAKISLPMEKRRDSNVLYNPTTLDELAKRYPSISWEDHINEILKPHAKLEKDEFISIAVPSYLDDIEKLTKSTPVRTMANYAMWRVAKDTAHMMSDSIRDRLIEFSSVLTGTNVKAPRWRKCVADTAGNFHLLASSLYVRNHFDESAKNNAKDMIETIRLSFRQILKNLDWMDEATKAEAFEKVDGIVPHIAYPDELLDDNKLEEYYRGLELNKESYMKSKLNIYVFKNNLGLSKFRKPVNKTEWISHGNAAIVNAFYNPTENSIRFPAGILQGAFFGNNKPKYLNYGGIATVMGHEITHGFDDQGRQYDKDGRLIEWWQPETKEKYLVRAQCIIDQYGNFTDDIVGLNLNGINTQGENIADNGGIKEAYLAYNKWEDENGVEPQLPGLNFTSQQMFWINAGHIWCEKKRPEALRSAIISGVHSPGKYRVLGPMSNRPEFSKDFNCPLGSKMNPVKKCSVW